MIRLGMSVLVLALFSCAPVRSGEIPAVPEVPEGLRLMGRMSQHMQKQQWKKALEVGEKALAASRKEYKAASLAKDYQTADGTCGQIATILIRQGLAEKILGGSLAAMDEKFEEASAELDRHFRNAAALAIFRTIVLPSITSTYLDLGEYGRAEPYSKMLVDATALLKGRKSTEYSFMAIKYGYILHRLGKDLEADTFVRNAVLILEKAEGVAEKEIANALMVYGMVKLGRNHYIQAEKSLRKAMKRARSVGDEACLAKCSKALAKVLAAQGKKGEAEAHALRHGELQKKLKGDDL